MVAKLKLTNFKKNNKNRKLNTKPTKNSIKSSKSNDKINQKLNEIIEKSGIFGQNLPKFSKNNKNYPKNDQNSLKMSKNDIFEKFDEIKMPFDDFILYSNQNKQKFKPNLKTAKICYEKEISAFKKSSENKSGALEFLQKKGVQKDKLFALVVKIQKSPLHNLNLIRQLIDFFKNKKYRDSTIALELLKDLFINTLLPDSKLEYFDFYKNHKFLSFQQILSAYFENEIKTFYFDFMCQIKKIILENTFDWIRIKAIKFAFELLQSKAEREEFILQILVDALAVKNSQIVSKIIFKFNQLLKEHPGMKLNVVKEIGAFLHLPKISIKSQYYAITIISNFIYSKTHNETSTIETVIKTLINAFSKFYSPIIFKTFKNLPKFSIIMPNSTNFTQKSSKLTKKSSKLTKNSSKFSKKIKKRKNLIKKSLKKGNFEKNEDLNEIFKTVSVLFLAINRAFPYLKSFNESIFKSQIEILLKTSKIPHFKTNLQTLTLLFKIYKKIGAIPAEFYAILFELIKRENFEFLNGENNFKLMARFFSLIYSSIESDFDEERIFCFIELIFENCLTKSPPIICTALLIISELMQNKKLSKKFFFSKKNFFEIEILKSHFHPIISLMAKKLSNGESLNYTKDPFLNLTLKNFFKSFLAQNENFENFENFGKNDGKNEKKTEKIGKNEKKMVKKRKNNVFQKKNEIESNSVFDEFSVVENKYYEIFKKLQEENIDQKNTKKISKNTKKSLKNSKNSLKNEKKSKNSENSENIDNSENSSEYSSEFDWEDFGSVKDSSSDEILMNESENSENDE